MQILFGVILIVLLEGVLQMNALDDQQTQSIIELYKKISEKDSLVDGLSLNDDAQLKLKTINTIRLVPLTALSTNRSILLFNVSLNKLQMNEEVKLIEFRLKLTMRMKQRRLRLIIRNSLYQRRRIRPLIISSTDSEYLSYDITDYLIHHSTQQSIIIRRQFWLRRHLQEASLVIYSRAPSAFLLPSPTRRMKRSVKQQQITGPCSRHDLFVDFNQLSFGTWVVQPKRFNAGVCRGDCPNPLSRSYYPTNHAMLLSLLHERGSAIQQPSCVPVRLRPLDLLYYDRRELVIKRHRGMQVEECGCR
ncbi:unnamed protein product [Adineta ricciae]|uniref:TGF-beta family profile domain-containing protein n=1 Tax=Adineta ricciae TaxID=249248 RepID=A0A815B0N3_ADIRI|nr:unnamed protein product [Adineta ricciae]CAF1524276.1 unnamed protein product [Adineta ricciae]